MRRALIVVAGLGACGRASADCGPARAWVKIGFDADPLGTELADGVVADLSAELARRGMDVCREGTGTPVASVTITARNPASVAVAIALGGEPVTRDVDLSGIPEDGRPLAIAVAVEETLTAIWAERAQSSEAAPEPPPPPPPAPPPEPPRRAPPRREPSVATGLRSGIEHFSGGQTHLGADVFGRLWALSRAGAEVALELRDGLRESTTHGVVESSAFGASAGAVVAVLPRGRRIGIDGALGVGVASVTFEGTAGDGARARSPTEIVVVGRASLWLSLRIAGPLRAEVGGGVGWPIRGFEGTDFGANATGATGLEVHARAGLVVAL